MLSVVFFGTSEESLPAFESLNESDDVDIVAVVTRPPKPIGRKQVLKKSAVHEAADSQGIRVLTPRIADDATAELKGIGADMHVVVSYGQILPKDIVDMPKHGTVNVHPSQLPRHRGATPVPATILAGDTQTAVSIFSMDEKMDHGPILFITERISVGRKKGGELLMELMQSAATVLPEVLVKFASGGISPVPQDHRRATFCHLLTRTDARIDWSKPAIDIERMVRAYDPWPGAWCEIEYRPGVWQRVKLLEAHVDTSLVASIEGLCVVGGQLVIGQLVIDQLQMAGKTPVSGEQFAKTHEDYCRPVR